MSDEETDILDLPEHLQSGLTDNRTISEVNAVTLFQEQQQAGQLDAVLNTYYGQHSTNQNVNAMRESLVELGYTEERIDSIVSSAETEHEYRSTHGHASNLAPNQLEYLDANNVRMYDLVISSDDPDNPDNPGRLYYLDRRVHDVDGEPVRVYLPPAIEFDPLTREQRREATQREDILSYIYIEPTIPEVASAGGRELTQDQRIQISAITMIYLNGEGTEADKLQYTHNIQQIRGISDVMNIEGILYQYFLDVDFEKKYRDQNNGLPQGITQEQYDWMRQHQRTYRYIGQPILFTEDGTAYYHTDGGQMLVPTQEWLDQHHPAAPRAGDGTRLLSNEEERRVNVEIANYYTTPERTDEEFLHRLQDIVHLNPEDPNDNAISISLNNLVSDASTERQYRQDNNGRPSQLSQLQYEYLRTKTVDQSVGHRWMDEQITMMGGQLVYRSQLDYQSNFISVPTDEQIQDFIEAGIWTPPETPEYGPDIPDIQDRVPPPRRDVPEHPHQHEPEAPEVEPVVDVPGLTEPIDIPDGPPVVPGQTEPIDPVTQEPIPVPDLDEQVARYERYFNDNQELYLGFREVYANILPVFTGVVGGFFAFSFKKIQERNTILEIVNDQIRFLEQAQQRIDNLIERNEQAMDRLNNLRQLEQQYDILGQDDLALLQQFRGLLAGTEENPDADPARLRQLVQQQAQRLADNNRDLLRIRDDILQAEMDADSLAMDIANTQNLLPQQIRDNLNRLIQVDYEILSDIAVYQGDIATGINIGTTLGLVLSGYLFPTYESLEDPYITADNIEYRPQPKKIEDKEEPEKLENIDKFQPRDVEIETGAKYPKIVHPMTKTFTPYKQGSKPLTYSQIQEYKQTLSSSELNNLTDKFLIFADDGKNVLPVKDHCKNVVKKTDQLIQRKIRR